MACGKQTDVAVMDFSKAFDKVDHQRLHVILKLKHGYKQQNIKLDRGMIIAWMSKGGS